ncbi:PREDICTED: toll/interleukin-1 receptor domain-containing adapter protein [Myotis brandtii]|uniref:toll/interleukin-1 receptor domain-containing adapter protein n=1 Tax=Myotis brandtii TaxID=109478 RepID=UPI000703DE3E|nr:PREDICTED: toll/interleukin-1 receptor domain-containing adapter protein [Myotis brandtii]
MASSTPLPASGSRSKKPLAKMAGWLRQALSKKPKEMPVSQETTSSDAPPRCSDDPPSPDLSSTASAESPAALPPALESTSCSSSGGGAASSSSDGGAASSSSGRWSRDYDVCVCHSEEDLAAVQELVAYLEDSPASLRCFLQLRDSAPGALLVAGLARAAYPAELRFMYFVDGRGPDQGFRQVKEAILRYLQHLS